MTQLDPIRSPVLVEPVDLQPQPASPLRWLRLAVIGLFSLAFLLVFHFPSWALLVLPLAGLATQGARRWAWLYRAACSAVFAAYAAEIIRLVGYPWPFRFATSFALFMAAAFCWGMRMDEFN